jgi:hypothetical protein
VDGEEENWRDNEESLEFAVLEAVRDVGRAAKNANFCMRKGCGRGKLSSTRSLQNYGDTVTCLVSSCTLARSRD